jgi:L-rhamnose-H+ transport protein
VVAIPLTSLIAVVGSVLPMVMYRPEQLSTPGGQLVIAALAVMLVGIVLCGYAGNLREKALAAAALGGSGKTVTTVVEQKRPSFKLGLLFCVLSGVLSPMVNFALIKGDTLRALAVQHGASPLWAINAVWLLVFTVAYGVFVLYALFLMARHGTFSEWTAAGTGKYWLLAAIMGFLWAAGIIAYGTGVANMGSLGPYAGWPLLLIAAIGASNVSGIVIGEWKGTGAKPIRVMGAALAVLFVAAIMLGVANRMLAA